MARSPLLFVSFLSALAACTTTVVETKTTPKPAATDTPPDPGDDTTTTTTPDAGVTPAAFKPSFPTVVNAGGKTIASPKVMPIVFTGDSAIPQITSFTQKIAASAFWANDGHEYGVGAITPVATMTVNETPATSLTSTAITQWLTDKLSGATPAFGAPDKNTLYAIYYPAGVNITLDGSSGAEGQSCQGYGGYHDEITVGTTSVGYAVLPRCDTIDYLTVAASHEYFEWATDPFPETAPAYIKLDDAHWAWGATMIGELGDLCTFLDLQYVTADVGFQVQRMWSNALSLAGKFPCAPEKTSLPYVQAIAHADDDMLVPDLLTGSPLTTKAIRVAPGGSRDVDVTVYANESVAAPIKIMALTYEQFYQESTSSGFSARLSAESAPANGTVKMTVTAPTASSYDILVMTAFADDADPTYWPVVVTNDDGAGAGSGAATGAIPTRAIARALARAGHVRTTRLGLPRR